MPSTAILLMAVGKYDQFIEQMITSIEKHWKHPYHIYLFTDKIHDLPEVSQLKIPYQKFPYCSLYRYHYFLQYQEYITEDYVFYVDIDARFVGDVGDEILGDITAVQHCGYYSRPGAGGWETNPNSVCYLPQGFRHRYYGGGFQGGESESWWDMCEILADKYIDEDMNKGIKPVHNDETAFNAYCNLSHDINVLSPEYHYTEDPEKAKLWGIDHLTPKLLLLEKEHETIR